MIIQFIEKLNTKELILASSSARRQEILRNIGLRFKVLPSTFEENLKEEDFVHPRDFVTATAEGKADEVLQRFVINNRQGPDLIIGCDTCVTLDGKIYGKPRDDQHAFDMLSMWSGRHHEVISGVCLLHRLAGDSFQKITFSETTKVKFGELTQDVIQSYVNSGEPRGKAGGYGIQGLGGTLVESLHGDYFNVVGFPLHQFCSQLRLILLEEGS